LSTSPAPRRAPILIPGVKGTGAGAGAGTGAVEELFGRVRRMREDSRRGRRREV